MTPRTSASATAAPRAVRKGTKRPREIVDRVLPPATIAVTAGGGDQPAPVRRTGIAELKVAKDAAVAYDVRPKLANAVDALGNNTIADLLGVSRSQPGRWARGEEGISAANQAAIVDLDFVLSKLLQAMPADLAGIWLVSSNAHLGGARPIDAFLVAGHRRAVEAIEAYDAGAYA